MTRIELPEGRKVLVILQNAWSWLYAGDIWPRDSWFKALKTSPTGRKLATIFGDNLDHPEVWIDNTTPMVGAEPSSKLPIAWDHLTRLFEEQDPAVVLACGKQAQEACARWFGPLVVMPHPAWRMLHSRVLFEVRNILSGPALPGRVSVINDKEGRVIIKPLEGIRA